MVKGFYEKDGIIFRCLLMCEAGVWLIEYGCCKEPVLVSHDEFASFVHVPAPDGALQIDSLGPTYEKTRLRRLETLQELISDDIHIIDRHARIKALKALAGRSGVSEKTLKRWYYAYLSGAGLYSKKRENKAKIISPDEKIMKWAIETLPPQLSKLIIDGGEKYVF
ncbi:hypothetical protein LJC56_11580 [Christensenellaceae bacterium OttesenSCG-928-K19]|nr:hypothetical protein [Christensenellaceae bacterium OttesenSCG-928-K19]